MCLCETPSTATVLHSDPPVKSVPAGSEAMCCFAVENGYPRWQLECDMEKAGQIPKGKKFADMVDLGDPNVRNSGNPDHKARFPTLHTGIAEPGIDPKFGQVSLAGRTRFNELTKLIRKYRRRESAKDAEAVALEMMQAASKRPAKRVRTMMEPPAAAFAAARVDFAGEATDDDATTMSDGEDDDFEDDEFPKEGTQVRRGKKKGGLKTTGLDTAVAEVEEEGAKTQEVQEELVQDELGKEADEDDDDDDEGNVSEDNESEAGDQKKSDEEEELAEDDEDESVAGTKNTADKGEESMEEGGSSTEGE